MREFQAILPLRGKIINAYKFQCEDKVLPNEEVRSMIPPPSTGIGEDQDLSKRRYGRIVIMTDADVDGSHIRTLLLTFFYRQMFELVKGGHVYVAQPPLFRVKNKTKTYYVQTEEEMRKQLLDQGLADAVFNPNDGRLVEGDEMTRLVRTLATLEEAIIALERRGISLRIHAERQDPTGRLPIYHVYMDGREEWFTTRGELDDFVAAQEKESYGQTRRRRRHAHAAKPAPLRSTNGDASFRRRARSLQATPVPSIALASASSSSTKSARSTPRSPTSPNSASASKPSSPKSAPAKKPAATPSAAAKTKPASKTSAASPAPSAPPAKRACRSPG